MQITIGTESFLIFFDCVHQLSCNEFLFKAEPWNVMS